MSKQKKQNFGDMKRAAAKSAEANKSNNQARKRSMAVKDIDALTDEQVIAEVRALYDSSKRDDHHEPAWTAMFFAGAIAYPAGWKHKAERKAIVSEMRSYLRSVANSPEIVTRMLGSKHVQEDGFLIGTTTWIFMGRARCTPVEYKGWTIIHRELSEEVRALEAANGLGNGQPTRFFMAYDADHRVGASAMSGDEIGPCYSVEEVRAHIDEYETETLSGEGPLDEEFTDGVNSPGGTC